MHIETVNINLGGGPLAAAALAALLAPKRHEATNTNTESPAPSVPKIGEPWPGIEGIYAGVSRGEDGEPDAHLVLLNAQPETDLTWDAAVAWAQGLGDGARLPSRFESALLYAQVRDHVDTDRWHWTGTQASGSYAWYQDFDLGGQINGGKKFEARARAVRRLIL